MNATRCIQSQCEDAMRRSFTPGDANLVVCAKSFITSIASLRKVENDQLFRLHRLTLSSNSQSALRYSQRHWRPDGANVVGFCQKDIESDIRVITAVWEYLRAPTTWLYTPQDYVKNTDTTSLTFLSFLGLPQLLLCRNDDSNSRS